MLISFFTFWILIFDHTQLSDNANQIFFFCFLFSNLIPLITVILLKKMGKIDDMDASKKEQRFLPLLLGIFYAGVGFMVLSNLDAQGLVRGLMFCFMTNTVIIIIITKYWKISIHAMGIAGPLTALWIHGFHSYIIIISIAIMLGWSRVNLRAHNITQVLAGYFLGTLLTWAQLVALF